MFTRFFLLLITLCSLQLPLYGNSQRIEHLVIDQLNVEVMTRKISEASAVEKNVLNRIKTKEGGFYSQAAFDEDLKQLVLQFYRVEPAVVVKNGKLEILLQVWENPRISQIIIEGNQRIKTSVLMGELALNTNENFDKQNFSRAFRKLKTYYIKQGFFEAELDYTVTHNEENNEVVITICIDEGRAGKINKIFFKGFSSREESDVVDIMLTKTHNFFLSWLTGEGLYNEDMVDHDRFMILNYLQNLGYADAQVEIAVKNAKNKNRINLYISAEKGQLYRIGNVSIEGGTLYTEEELRSSLTFCPDDPFSPETIHYNIERLTSKYGRCGYIDAFVNYVPKRSEIPYTYDIDLVIEEGDQYFVGMVKVFGNTSTQTKVILHETLLVPGEVFNIEKLRITEARLCNIGYFESVNVYAVKTDAHALLPDNYRDIHIEVEEANTGHLGAFLGFSTGETFFGGITLGERNFNSAGLRCVGETGLCALRGGGEYASISINLGSKTTSYGLSWTKPHFMDTPWSFGFDLDKTRTYYIADDYQLNSYGLTLHATYQYNPYVTIGTHFRVKNTDAHLKDKDDACWQLIYAINQDGWLSAFGASWNYNSTNHPISPSCGLRSRVEGELAGLGKYQFLSVGYLNTYYYNLWDFGTLKFQADMRFLKPLKSLELNDIPLDERLFLGGNSTIRGYRAYRLGPKYPKCTTNPVTGKKTVLTDADGNTEYDYENPKGGLSLQTFSAEYCKQLFSRAEGFVFFDAGAISEKPWKFGRFYRSVGYGLRLQLFENSPPLTVGMGYPLNAKDSSDVKKFFINVGGKF